MIALFVLIKKNRKPLPILGQMTEFELTNSTGEAFKASHLKNSVWVSNFIFTTCQGICPLLSKEMVRLQKRFQGKGLNLVSISVDPENDTPEALRSFAKRFDANTSNWHFLTGERKTIKNILEKNFKIGFSDNPLHHSDRFVLVDQNFKIRGYYSLSDKESLTRLVSDVSRLVN